MDGVVTQMGMGQAAAGGLSVTYRDAGTDTSNATAYSVTGLSVGAASARQYVVAAIFCRALGSNISLSSITIGGVSATTIASFSANDNAGGGGTDALYLVAAEVPTVTSVDVDWTSSISALRGAAAVWTVTGVTSLTPQTTATNSDSSSTSTASIGVTVTPTSAPALVFGLAATDDGTTGFDDLPTDVAIDVESAAALLAGASLVTSTSAVDATATPAVQYPTKVLATVIS